eukprot:gb/GEZN01006733.1/.p1 GENE.gb/GEZN01006733.1/~~gb/GEZN01006733.1/.p1  ORF type:complete len:330 (-),score=36.45 gb/GEZN01006733.1/:576-1565(-)
MPWSGGIGRQLLGLVQGTEYDGWPRWKFRDDESEVLEKLIVTMSILSFIGSIFIIACYNKFSEIRSFAFRLVFFVSVADMGTALGNFLGDAGGNADTWMSAGTGLCLFQAMVLSFFNLASMLWSVSIAFTLHQAFLLENKEYHSPLVEHKMQYYHVICWGWPALMTVLPLITSSYGDTGGWCWINANDAASKTWLLLQFYIPLWVFISYNLWVYVKVYRKMKLMLSGQMGRDMYRIRLYPLVLVVCWFWGSVNSIYTTFTGSLGPLWLNILHIFFASSMGAVNAAVYGFTPAVNQEVQHLLGCSGRPSSLSEAESTAYRSPSEEEGTGI